MNGLVGTHSDAFELLELADEVLDQVPRFVQMLPAMASRIWACEGFGCRRHETLITIAADASTDFCNKICPQADITQA